MMYTQRIIEFFKDNGYEVEITQRYKGGVKKECIVLKINKNINPSIMINEKEIEETGLDDYCNKILNSFKNINADDISKIFDIASKITEYDFIKDKVFIQLRPKTDSDKIVKKDFLNLEKIIRINLDAERSVVVNDRLLDSFDNVSENDLFKLAEKNTEKNAVIFNMLNYLTSNFNSKCNKLNILNDLLDLNLNDGNMYVISNKDNIFGSGIICCDKIMRKLLKASGKQRLAIIPSSIHEVILIGSDDFDVNKLLKVVDMIKQINDEVVDDVDVLSNYLYIYNNDGSWQVIQ